MTIILATGLTVDCSKTATENLKVYAVKYATSMFPKKFIYYGDKSSEKLPFTWLFYYVEYKDRKILVDTGFNNEKLIKMFEISDFRDPIEILEENGIAAESITDVIITHSHFDHIGNVNKFANARIIINKKEFDSFMKGTGLMEVRNFMKDNPNVYTFDKSISLFEFFRIEKVGGHSEGSSVIFFRYDNADYCFTGDEVYLDENIINQIGSGSVVNHKNNIAFIKVLLKSGAKTFIFHDKKYYDDKRRMIQVIP